MEIAAFCLTVVNVALAALFGFTIMAERKTNRQAKTEKNEAVLEYRVRKLEAEYEGLRDEFKSELKEVKDALGTVNERLAYITSYLEKGDKK